MLTTSQDDILVPITFTEKGSPVAGVPMPQIGQTNQLLFPHHPTDAPPTKLFLTTSKETVDIAEYPAKDGQLKVLHSLHGHTSATLSQALSPTGRYLAIGGSDANISLWDTHDWVCRRTLWLEGPVKTVSFSWDGSFIAGGTDEGTGIEIVSSPSTYQSLDVTQSHYLNECLDTKHEPVESRVA